MVEVIIRLNDNGQLEVNVGGLSVSPLVYVGMCEAAKVIMLTRKQEEPSRIISAVPSMVGA
jgi:hypothetical protein